MSAAPVTPQVEVIWMNGEVDTVPKVAIVRQSPTESWLPMFGRVLDHLRAGVQFVVVPDDRTKVAYVYSGEFGLQKFGPETQLTRTGFSVRVADFFA